MILNQFDNRGLIDTMQRATVGVAFKADFSFDPIGRLSSTVNDATGTTNDLTISQTFSPSSQIVSQTRSNDSYSWSGPVAVNRNYTTNGLNQYTVAGPASFTYDPNGNLTGEPGISYVYDIENRLVSASGGKTATLTYDPMGRLFQAIGTTTNNRFLYDGDELVAEFDSAGTLARRFVHSDNVDDPVVEYAGASVGASFRTFLMPDERGSIAGRFNNAGTTVVKNNYDEYGIPGASNVGRFQYTGQIFLPELGMYHYKARIYSPTLGRFLQVDPIGYADQYNLYAYVGDDPVNRSDPSGKYVCSGSKDNCAAVSAALDRGRAALASGKLSKSDAARISGVLKTYGKEGERNNVGVTFLSRDALRSQSGGAAFTKYFEEKGVSLVVLPDNFSKFGETFKADRMATGATADQVKGFSARDERANTVFHEGQHARDQQALGRNLTRSEQHPSAYQTGEAINRAFGSRSTREISNAITGDHDYDY